MIVTPINYVSMFRLVPVFEWEAIEPVEPAPTPAPTADTNGGCVDPQPSDKPQAEMRLVFKGFQWRPGLECLTFPRPQWLDLHAPELQGGPSLQDDERRRLRELEARRPKPDPSGPHRPELDKAGESPAADPSE
jgi:hypothetical protein